MYNRSLSAFFYLLTIFAFCSPSRADIWPKSIEQRILAGLAPTSESSYAVASIRFRNTQGTTHLCGGFIINKRWVGTAAQCLTESTINNTVVAVGRPTVTGGIIYGIIHIEKHQNYNVPHDPTNFDSFQRIVSYGLFDARFTFPELTLAHDIGLLRTSEEIVFTASVRPIPLGTPNVTSFVANIYGWGRVSATGGLSETLRTSTFIPVGYETCLSRFPFVTRRFINPDRQICFVSNRSGTTSSATCPGDAGGPIVFDNAVIGIISWVEPCVGAQTSVHTRISFYINWILRFTSDDD